MDAKRRRQPRGIPSGGEFAPEHGRDGASDLTNPELDEPAGVPLDRKGRAWASADARVTVDAGRSGVPDGTAEGVARDAAILVAYGWSEVVVNDNVIVLATRVKGHEEYWHIRPHAGQASRVALDPYTDRETTLDTWRLGPHDKGPRAKGDDPGFDDMLRSLSDAGHMPIGPLRGFVNRAVMFDDHPYRP